MAASPRLIAVVAVGEGGVIGEGGQLPWRLPADLRHFKAVTTGKPVLMGRRTYESIGKPLPGRLNVVITRASAPAGCLAARSLEEALALPEVAAAPVVAVIGGARLYAEAMPLVDELHLTRVHGSFEGDTFFHFDPAGWEKVESVERPADEENPWALSFERWRRKT